MYFKLQSSSAAVDEYHSYIIPPLPNIDNLLRTKSTTNLLRVQQHPIFDRWVKEVESCPGFETILHLANKSGHLRNLIRPQAT